jgi:ribosomal protein S27AE
MDDRTLEKIAAEEVCSECGAGLVVAPDDEDYPLICPTCHKPHT